MYNLGAGVETLTLEGGRKELTLQLHHPSVSHLLLNTRREGECDDWEKKGEESNF